MGRGVEPVWQLMGQHVRVDADAFSDPTLPVISRSRRSEMSSFRALLCIGDLLSDRFIMAGCLVSGL